MARSSRARTAPDSPGMSAGEAESIRRSAQIAVSCLKFFLETLDSVTLLD
jgi:hypothetical protein